VKSAVCRVVVEWSRVTSADGNVAGLGIQTICICNLKYTIM
jgi:hypothetical protein